MTRYIYGKNPCVKSNSPVCGSDGNDYNSISEFCQVNGNDSKEYIVKYGLCCTDVSLCFQKWSYKKLTRGYGNGKHIATTGSIPAGFVAEISWGLLINKKSDSVFLYHCTIDGSTLLKTDQGCNGKSVWGSPIGHIFTKQLCDGMPVFIRAIALQLAITWYQELLIARDQTIEQFITWLCHSILAC